MDAVGTTISVFTLIPKIWMFVVEFNLAPAALQKEIAKIEDFRKDVESAIHEFKTLRYIKAEERKAIMKRIDETIKWLSNFLPDQTEHPAGAESLIVIPKVAKHADYDFMIKRVELEHTFSAIKKVFKANDTDLTRNNTSTSNPPPGQPPVNRGRKNVSKRLARRWNSVIWMVSDNKKFKMMTDGLDSLTQRWRAITTALQKRISNANDCQRALLQTRGLIGPFSSSIDACKVLRAGCRMLPDETESTLKTIRLDVVQFLKDKSSSLLWFQGPVCSGKSTLATLLNAYFPDIMVEAKLPTDQRLVVTISHIQFVGDSSELYILQDIVRQLADKKLFQDGDEQRLTGAFSLSASEITNMESAILAIQYCLASHPICMILDGIETSSRLWATVSSLMNAYSKMHNMKVISFSRDSSPTPLCTSIYLNANETAKRDALESQVETVAAKNEAVQPYVERIVEGLLLTCAYHCGLIAVFMLRLRETVPDDIQSLVDGLEESVFNELSIDIERCAQYVDQPTLNCLLYVVALSGEITIQCVSKFGKVFYGLMVNSSKERARVGDASNSDGATTPNSSTEQTPPGDFTGALRHPSMAKLLQVNGDLVSLKNPNQAEQILGIITTKAPNFSAQIVQRVCDIYNTDPDLVQLMRKVIRTFPESRLTFRKAIEESGGRAAMLREDLKRAGYALLTEVGTCERIDLRRE